MATLAWIFEKNTATAPRDARNAQRDRFRLRPLPNEEIHVFTKRIDNSRVVREHDPRVTGAAVKTLSMACLGALVMVGLIVPAANSYLAGYTLTEMNRQTTAMETEFAKLSARESELTSLDALARAAKNQKFLDPSPDNMVVLNDQRSGAVALNRKNKQ